MGRVGPIQLTDAVRAEYEELFDTCELRREWSTELAHVVADILKHRARYEAASQPIGVPWWFIAAVHERESSGDFAAHLHNGDPLTARTVNVPAGRPANGTPPFTWEASAADALRLKHLDEWDDWSVGGALFQLERYNGFGYRQYHAMRSPYLWSGSTHYARGKYASDGHFDATLVDQQLGAATLLHWLNENAIIKISEIGDAR